MKKQTILFLFLQTILASAKPLCVPSLVPIKDFPMPYGMPYDYSSSVRGYTDGKVDNLIFVANNGTTKLELPPLSSGKVTALSQDNNAAIISAYEKRSTDGQNSQFLITEIKSRTPKIQKLTGDKLTSTDYYNRMITSDGKYLLEKKSVYENGVSRTIYKIQDLTNGRKREVIHEGYESSVNILGTGDPHKFYSLSSSSTYVLDLENSAEDTLPIGDFNSSSNAIAYDASSHQLARITNENGRVRLNIQPFKPGYIYSESGRNISLDGLDLDYSSSVRFSHDGSKIIISSYRAIIIVDAESGKIIAKKSLESYRGTNGVGIDSISPSGKQIVIRQYTNSGNSPTFVFSLDENSGELVPSPKLDNSPLAVDDNAIWHNYNGVTAPKEIKMVCASSIVEARTSNCAPDPTKNLPLSSDVKKWLDDSSLKLACSSTYDSSFWESVTTTPKENEGITIEQLRLFLYRFQRPRGIDSSKHLSVLLALFNSSFVGEEPEMISGVLESLYLKDKNLYAQLFSALPWIKKHKSNFKKSSPCRTQTENEKINQDLKSQLTSVSSSYGPFENIEHFLPINAFIQSLPSSEKTKLQDEMTEKIRTRAQGSSDFSSVFTSKLYYLVADALNPLFGKEMVGLTDMTFVKEGDSIVPILLGGHAIGDTNKTEYGFYAKRIGRVGVKQNNKYVDHDVAAKIQWLQDGKPYEGVINMKHFSTDGFIPKEKAPKYDELWKDGKLTGAILVGSNLSSHSVGLLDQYLSYYMDEGFEFPETKTAIPDMKAFFKEGVEKGTWDYFVKEAHSDGDNMNLFRINKQSEALRGVKKNPNGTEEIIYLVYPKESADTVLLPNFEFGEWIREREKAGQGQLVYFNTSCSSYNKVVREIEATRSATLLNVATTNSATTFSVAEDSALKLVLSAFREKKDFEGIRTALKLNASYRNHTGDNYIFPDEKAYNESIMNNLLPFEVRTSIFSADGKPYNFDEQIRHLE